MTRRPQKPLFERGLLTTKIISELTSALATQPDDTAPAILVGDGVAPPAGGWPGGSHEAGDFVPYTVLVVGEGTPAQSPADLGQSQDRTWNQVYSLRSVGESRDHAEWIADRARRAWSDLPHGVTALLNDTWKIQSSRVTRMGSMNRMDQEQPTLWEVSDSLSVVLTE